MSNQGRRITQIQKHLTSLSGALADIESLSRSPNADRDAREMLLVECVQELGLAVAEIAETLKINAEM
jgi:hypothetical protein